MFAAGKGHLEVVGLLLDRGADPTARDGLGQTAADLARINGHRDVADRIEAASKD